MESSIITPQNYKEADLLQWEQEFSYVYGHKNETRDPESMWLRAVSDASKMGESVRKGAYYESMEYLTHTFAWILTTIHKLIAIQNVSSPILEGTDGRLLTSAWDILVEKYPNSCPYCGQIEYCRCAVYRKDLENETKLERRERLRRFRQGARRNAERLDSLPLKLSEIGCMFNRIYGQAHYGVGIESISFHFLEEVGEVAWCITSLKEGTSNTKDADISIPMQLSEEFADVIAWSFAIVGKLGFLADQFRKLEGIDTPWNYNGSPDESIDSPSESIILSDTLLPIWLWFVYEGAESGSLRCPTCHSRPCKCGDMC